jgi:hypothetical protein
MASEVIETRTSLQKCCENKYQILKVVATNVILFHYKKYIP